MCVIWIILDHTGIIGPVLYSIWSPGREIDLLLIHQHEGGGFTESRKLEVQAILLISIMEKLYFILL